MNKEQQKEMRIKVSNAFTIRYNDALGMEVKDWGLKQEFGTHSICYILEGGFCSWHLHQYKVNHFALVYGQVRIDYGTHDGYIQLYPGMTYSVANDLLHSFLANCKSILIEYYTADVRNDIKRTCKGGIKNV